MNTSNIHLSFILVDPQVPENVGFICRSLKNMGFDDLRIVSERNFQNTNANKTAYQSHDILEDIQYHQKLSSAIKDADLVIGTTAKNRKNRYEIIGSDQIKSFIGNRKQHLNRVAMVFGSESNGLSKSDERACHLLSTIPMSEEYPSINLSHSVMIYAYELRQIQDQLKEEKDVSHVPFSRFESQISQFLNELEIEHRQPELFQRLVDRIRTIDGKDYAIALSLLRYLRNLTQRN